MVFLCVSSVRYVMLNAHTARGSNILNRHIKQTISGVIPSLSAAYSNYKSSLLWHSTYIRVLFCNISYAHVLFIGSPRALVGTYLPACTCMLNVKYGKIATFSLLHCAHTRQTIFQKLKRNQMLKQLKQKKKRV